MDQCPCSGRRLRINYVRLQEREAKRWAMELHDGLIPHIASVKMEVEYCAELLTNSNCKVRAQVDLIKDKLDVFQEYKNRMDEMFKKAFKKCPHEFSCHVCPHNKC
jgi:signal transduction histidine kinase